MGTSINLYVINVQQSNGSYERNDKTRSEPMKKAEPAFYAISTLSFTGG